MRLTRLVLVLVLVFVDGDDDEYRRVAADEDRFVMLLFMVVL